MTSDSRRAELREADQRARRRAQTDFDRPLALEAGAGTGKTTALVARVVAWALGPGWERAAGELARRAGDRGEPVADEIAARALAGVTAITFTEAAAAQMSTRVGEALLRLARGHEPPRGFLEEALPADPEPRRGRARALLAALDQVRVSTIHAFCRRLLADHPLEAGLHPELTVDADGRLVEGIVQEVLERHLRDALAGEPAPDLLAVMARGQGPPELAAALLGMVEAGLPAAALERDPLKPPRVAAYRTSLRASLEELIGLIAEPLAAEGIPDGRNAAKLLAALQELASAVAEAGDDATDLERLRERLDEILPANLRDHLAKWRHAGGSQAEERAFAGKERPLRAAVDRLRTHLDTLGRLDGSLLQAARRLLAPLLSRVRLEMRRRGVAGFQDLLAEALELLRQHPQVAAWERRRIDQLLVDEFQDTDRIQAEIVRRLALEGPEEERPGLFVVGDPKQSIYGWRQADLEAYEQFLASIGEEGLERLSVNFRSVPPILDEVDRWVEPVMRHEQGLQPAYQPLVPQPERVGAPGFTADGRAPVEVWVTVPEGEDGLLWRGSSLGEARDLEAAALAADIARLHRDHGVEWRQVGVLSRSLVDVDRYLAAFRAAGIPYRVSRDRLYYQRREILDATAAVAAVVDPNDHLALLTLLRSPAVGLPDAAILPLWRRDFQTEMSRLTDHDPAALRRLGRLVREAATDLPADIPRLDRLGDWEESLLAAVEALAFLRASFRDDPGDVFVEHLRALLLLEPTESARYLGRYRVANLERFFRLLLEGIEAGRGDLQGLLRALRRGVAEAREEVEGRPKGAGEDAVQVLSIHTAKGLDFEHVYLIDVARRAGRGRSTNDFRFTWSELDGKPEYRLLGVPTLGAHELRRRQRRVAAAERVRLLYVALTRAKERLVISGRWDEGPRPKEPETAETLLDLLTHREGLPESLATVVDALPEEPAARPVVPAEGFAWVFPGRDARDLDLHEPEPPTPPDPTALRHEAETLRDLAARAADRMERPLGAPVSGEGKEELFERLEQGDGRRRDLALAIGTAIHVVLERLDPTTDLGEELARLGSELPRLLAELAPADRLEEAVGEAAALLERFAAGELARRLAELAPGILARELPVLLPANAGARPVAFLAGAIDLLYRDPASGELVVADYKTDRVDGDEALRARAEGYRTAGRLYCRAVEEALGLPEPPRFELWFLLADRVVTLSSTG